MSHAPVTTMKRAAGGATAAAVVGALVVFGAGAAHAAIPHANSDPQPTVTSVSPNTGPQAGGTAVTITGTGFVDDGTESVSFLAADGTTYAAASAYVSATSITATSPAVAAGGVYGVAVSTGGGQSPEVAGDDFTYVAANGSAPVLTRATSPVVRGASVTISGTAAPGNSVDIFTHGPGASYAKTATKVAGSDGSFSYTFTATSDIRYYAAVGSAQSAPGLLQIAPTVSGPASRTVTKGSRTAVSGTAGSGNGPVTIHFHKAGTAANDYSIVRAAPVSAAGTWSYPFAATVDYRLYVTSADGLVTPTYLYQAR